MVDIQQDTFPILLSPCNSGRRRTSNEFSNSPEFEFWVTRNTSFPQPNLLTADELFSGGVILPLQNLHLTDPPPPTPPPENPPEPSGSDRTPKPDPEPAHISNSIPNPSGPALTSSKRWTDIFKKTTEPVVEKVKISKDNKKKHSSSTGVVSAAELNINIWPFSRSRSAGNAATRPKPATGRKVSSAPCSRSNSGGESKTRKWPNSPSRAAGVHLGRTSPVWQVRRGKNVSTGSKSGRVLKLNVPMCIGYGQQLSCRSDESSAFGIAAAAAVATGGVAGEGVRSGSGNFFNIKGLFSKKVY